MRLVSRCIAKAGNFVRALYWNAIYGGYREKYAVASSFRFNGYNIQLYGGGRIELGSNSYVGELSTIQSVPGCAVRIAHGCMISHNVRIYTETAVADCDMIGGPVEHVRGDVHIGAGAWVGANVYVAPGVSIGEDSVVGANSVVTRSVPPGEIWGGVPARLIRPKRR